LIDNPTRIVLLIIIAAAGLVAYNYFTTGEMSLIPSSTLSEEEQELKSLADSFREAQKQVRQAERTAAVGGIGSIDAVEDAIRDIEQIESAIVTLKSSLKSASAMKEAERLEREIEAFKRGVR
jgi:predicted negative regulator of RcsB-dependent stress response